MTGSSSAIRKFVRVFVMTVGAAALLAVPLSATPITGEVTDIFSLDDLTYQVVMKNSGAAINSQGFLPGGNPVTFTSLPASLTLDNNLPSGAIVSAAALDLNVVLGSLVQGTSEFLGCTGSADCGGYTHDRPTFTLGAYPASNVKITVVSAGGTTYAWDYLVGSSTPFQLDLATAPGMLAALSNGEDLTIGWTQTLQLVGAYKKPTGVGQNKCEGCTLTFELDDISRSATVHASLDMTSESPTAVPEPSSGILLGLGLIAGTTILRRKFFRR